MKQNYIQLGREDRTRWLISTYPNAFLLLSLIAINARRVDGYPDGLEIGDAIIDCKSCGLSRQQYRTAIEKLVEFKMIKIIHNGKKFFEPRKSTIRITIKSMLVKLIDSDIYDINSESSNQHVNQRATNEQPTSNHKQERIRKNKKEKEEPPISPPSSGGVEAKIFFRDHVSLTQAQHDKLLSDHGAQGVFELLDILEAYKGSSEKKYASDYHTMIGGGWVLKRWKEEKKILPVRPGSLSLDRRAKNIDGTVIPSPVDGRF